jgi:hypothetical protein
MAYEIEGAQAFQSCRAECQSGCYHGATEAFFRDHGVENLSENLNIICNNELNSFFSHQCVHGIGHGLMAWADYDIHEALHNCDLLSGSETSCYSGVFMENVVGGLASEQGHFTQYLSDDPHFPCTVVEDKYKEQCYFYQTSRMIQLFGTDFSKVASVCLEATEQEQHQCFQSMGRDVGNHKRGNVQGAIAACSFVPQGNKRILCLNGAVQDWFWDPSGQDSALQFCHTLQDSGEKSGCYTIISQRASEVLETKEDFLQFCAKTAQDGYQEWCLRYQE